MTLTEKPDRILIMKLKELLTSKWRDAQGRLTDEAYDAYKATCNAYPGGFVPDDELDNVDVIGLDKE